MGSQGKKVAIQVALGLLILVLAIWLYQSITAPYAEVERQQAITDMTRARMGQVRTALVYYEQQEDAFPGTLDSLMLWMETDSLMMAAADSIFDTPDFLLDSLLYSPRTGSRFAYTLNDTGRVAIYLLEDPDSEDHIGSATPDITQLNAASWE